MESDAQFESLVANVIPVVHHFLVIHSHQYPTSHSSDKDSLGAEVKPVDRHVCKDDGSECLQRLFPCRTPWANNSTIDLYSGSNPLQRLVASEHTELRGFL